MTAVSPKSYAARGLSLPAVRETLPLQAVASPAAPSISTPLGRLLRPQAAYRWLMPSLAAITPQYIESTLRGALAGSHVQAWELFDLMQDTDPEIAACCAELIEGVMRKKLIIEPFHEEDESPTPEAMERMRVVSAALKRMRPDPCADENDLDGTIKDLLDGWFKGQVVLEVDWSAGEGSDRVNILRAGKLGDITAPRATYWVHPVCYAWSMEGRLGLRRELGVQRAGPDAKPRGYAPGNVWNSTTVQPRPSEVDPFPPDQFLIGLHKHKSGAALGGAQLRVLAWWWCASNFCGDWLLNLAQLFGIPFRKAKYSSGTDEATKEEIRQMLQLCGSAGYILTPEGADVEFMEAGGGAQNSPQAFLFEFADRQKRKVLLGQTMSGSSGTMGKGGGQAFGTVEAGVKADRIDAAGKYACSVLNLQLVPAILRLNYGDDEECPVVRLLEEEEGKLEDAQRDQALVAMGLPMGANFIRKKYGVPAPSEGEELLAPPAAADGRADLPVSQDDADEPAMAAKNADTITALLSDDLAHARRMLGEKLPALLAIADPVLREEKLKAVMAQIKRDLAADPSCAPAIFEMLTKAFAQGART